MSQDMRPIPLTLIVAATPSHAIGRSASLPWRLPKEMAYFARVTKGEHNARNAVVMGRKSWDGIPERFRPLAGRINVVVSRQSDFDLSGAVDTHLANSLPDAVAVLNRSSAANPTAQIDRTFLIGGAQLYSHALKTPSPHYLADRILLTRLKTEFDNCDAFLEPISQEEGWMHASHRELCDWVGFQVPEGDQIEKDRNGGSDVTYEFQMWTRAGPNL